MSPPSTAELPVEVITGNRPRRLVTVPSRPTASSGDGEPEVDHVGRTEGPFTSSVRCPVCNSKGNGEPLLRFANVTFPTRIKACCGNCLATCDVFWTVDGIVVKVIGKPRAKRCYRSSTPPSAPLAVAGSEEG